jgi:hypothetical protein
LEDWAGLLELSASIYVQMEDKAELVLRANFGTPYGSGSQLILNLLGNCPTYFFNIATKNSWVFWIIFLQRQRKPLCMHMYYAVQWSVGD